MRSHSRPCPCPARRTRGGRWLLGLGLGLLTVAAQAGCTDAAACARPPAAPVATDQGPAQRLTQLLNAYRHQHGLDSLQREPGLDAIAEAHSRWMADHRQLSHHGFARRFELAQAPLCVENLGAGRPSAAQPQRLLDAWIASPSHHVNLREPRTRFVGVAEVDGYVTVFACDQPAATGAVARP